MTARNYSSTASEKVLANNVTNVATQITLDNVTNLPTPPYTLVLNPDTAIEEIVTVNADQSGVSAPTLKVTRAQDGTTAQVHTAGQVVKHMITARDLQEPQDHINATTNVHGYTATATEINILDGATLSTAELNILDGVTATTAEINILDGVTATASEINILDGATLTTTELNYVDGVTSAIQTQIDSLIPKGLITPFAGSSAPTGWLLCNGNAVSRTTYSALFAVVGTTYGSGDGSTTFNLPDLLGRTPIGAGAGTDLTSRTLGVKLGAETLPAHTHTISHSHSASASTSVSGDGAHEHSFVRRTSTADTHDHEAWASGDVSAPPDNRSGETETNQTVTIGGGGHSHSASTSVSIGGTDTANSGSTGTGTHGVMQPSTVVNFIIKH